jgi:calnexin
VNPPKLIDDVTDRKPSDWVDTAEIDDPNAKKPEDWDDTQPEFIKDPERSEVPEGWLPDEPKYILDPDSQKPDDWEDDIHGEWEAPTIPNPKCDNARGCGEYEPPLIKNPAYKGKWRRPKIANPAYKGPWRPRQVVNPEYHEDLHPHNFEPLIGAGFELWMVSRNIGYGNVFIGNDEAVVHRWNQAHFAPKHAWQEEEKKRIDAAPKLEDGEDGAVGGAPPAGQGFAERLLSVVKEQWEALFQENQIATIGFTAALVLLPIAFCCLCCRRKSKAPPPDPSRASTPAPHGNAQ